MVDLNARSKFNYDVLVTSAYKCQEEASTITDEDELYDRCETWIAARVTKEGKFADEETQKKAEEIVSACILLKFIVDRFQLSC